jgi:hypothetical protein
MSMHKATQKRKPSAWWVLLVLGGVLLLASAGLMLALGNGNAEAPHVQAPTQTSDPLSQVPRVQLDSAKASFDAGEAVFLDVRSQADYDQSHIPGAVLIPLNELPGRLMELDPQAKILTYCT